MALTISLKEEKSKERGKNADTAVLFSHCPGGDKGAERCYLSHYTGENES